MHQIGRRPTKLLVAIIVCLSSTANAQGLVTVTGLGMGDDFSAIGVSHRDPNFILIGSASGKLYRSVDSGLTWKSSIVVPSYKPFYGRERSDDPRGEFMPGMPGKSQHFHRWLYASNSQPLNLSLYKFLQQKVERTEIINWIEVDWHDENRIWVGTGDGLYLSTDKGSSFTRVWQGRIKSGERMVNAVATNPADPNHIFVGTAAGLFHSNNRGLSFEEEMNYYVQGAYVRGIFFDAEQPGLVHMAMGGSAMASPDAGKHWITTHWDEWAAKADVQWVSLGPNNLRLIGTRDGLFASFQGGEMGTWQRRTFRFTGETLSRVMATKDPNVWVVTTDQAVWISTDAGLNFRKLLHTGGKEIPRSIMAFGNDLEQLWVITNRRVFRWGFPLVMRKPTVQQQIPPLEVFWRRVLMHHNVYFDQVQRQRDRAPWAALLPDLWAGFRYTMDLTPIQISAIPHLDHSFTYFHRITDRGANFEIMATWDLTRLIFDKRQLPHVGRIDRNVQEVRDSLSDRIPRLYMEYEQLTKTDVHPQVADELSREFREIRRQELAAYFDAISGGYWTEATGERR